MVYKLNVTEHADELLDRLVYHLIYRLKNKQAAKHLLDRIDAIYDRADFISHMVVCIDFNGKEKADALAGGCRGCGMAGKRQDKLREFEAENGILHTILIFIIFCVLLFMFMALSAPGLIVE